MSGTASSGRSRSSSTSDTAWVSTQPLGNRQRVSPAERQPAEPADGTLAHGLDLGPARRGGLAHRPPAAAAEQRLQPLRQRPARRRPGPAPARCGRRGRRRRRAGGRACGPPPRRHRGPRPGSGRRCWSMVSVEPQAAQLAEAVGDGLRDRHERSRQRNLHQREAGGLTRPAHAGGHAAVPETGAEAESGRTRGDQAVDVLLPAGGRARAAAGPSSAPARRRAGTALGRRARWRAPTRDRGRGRRGGPGAGRGSAGRSSQLSGTLRRRRRRRCTNWQIPALTLDGMVLPLGAARP